MRRFKTAAGWAALAAGCLLASAVALAAPEGETQKTESQKGISELNADTVEYNVKTGQMKAEGNVVIHYDGGVVTGASAAYNTKTSTGMMTGGVVADKEDMHLDCDRIELVSKTKMRAIGNVHGWQKDKRVDAPIVEYDNEEGYACLPEGGSLSAAEGTFTADYMEGWTKTEHAKGVGNAHIISPPRDFEGGGDEAEYFGKETGKLVLTGHAWAVQENNTLKSGRLTVFLKDRSNTETVTNEEGKEEQ
jgi:lipopolysaccharide export system protein LptA